MKARVRTLGRLAAALALACGLVGCSAANPGTPGAGSETWPKPTADLHGVTLKLWTQPATNTYADQVIAASKRPRAPRSRRRCSLISRRSRRSSPRVTCRISPGGSRQRVP